MAKKSWTTDRKWDMAPKEQRFVDLLIENGFKIVGIREYMSKTDYLVEKDGIEFPYEFPHEPDINSEKWFENFNNSFEMYKELKRLKAMV